MSDKPEDIGSGALFKNAKQENPVIPGDVCGRKYWVSGWINTSAYVARLPRGRGTVAKEVVDNHRPRTEPAERFAVLATSRRS
jgi:hypothetical protein